MSAEGDQAQAEALMKRGPIQNVREVLRLREEVDRQLGRHLCYTGEPARRRFWKAVDEALAQAPEASHA
jgi:hypothetical protein